MRRHIRLLRSRFDLSCLLVLILEPDHFLFRGFLVENISLNRWLLHLLLKDSIGRCLRSV